MADLVKDKKIEGIKDIRDESDKDGVRVVIDLKRSFSQQNFKSIIFLHPAAETFHMNMLALVDGIEPHVLNLKTVLEKYLEHRQLIVKKRTEFELKKPRSANIF